MAILGAVAARGWRLAEVRSAIGSGGLAGTGVPVTTDRQRVTTRVSRAAWRLEQADRERTWALVSARAEGISIRTLATAAGLSPSRVHQLVAAADLDALDAALGELRAAGWPAPENPDSGEDTEPAGRDTSPAGYPMR
jgi:hypothetical protein